MKTFEEAFDVIRENRTNGKLTADVISSKHERFNSKKWKTLIMTLSRELVIAVATTAEGDGEDLLIEATVCEFLRISFELGLLTGIEMEKSA